MKWRIGGSDMEIDVLQPRPELLLRSIIGQILGNYVEPSTNTERALSYNT